MNPNFLDFEQPIAELEAKIQELRHASHGSAFNIEEEIGKLQEKLKARTAEIFKALTPWQISQLARHPQRPYTLDYVKLICEEFHELAGDRAYSDDAAIVGGLARIEGKSMVILGHQKGRDTKSKIKRNFGMPRPEGYRKALRLMKLAERFRLPLLTFIDTPGAYPGVGAEERGQSEAIARNLLEMAELRIPIVCTVIGEGGSGGALAIGVGDRTLMLEYGTYSVISPEGCASILWKSAERAEGRRGGARPHRAAPDRTRADRPDRARAVGWRASRSAGNGHAPERRAARPARTARTPRHPHVARTALRAPAQLRALPGRVGAAGTRMSVPGPLAAALQDAPPGAICIGYSGGVDSTVLLHALAAGGREVRALHIDHGLQPASSGWAEHCRAFCGALGVGITVLRVQVDRIAALGTEGAARAARHAAFAAELRAGETLALAHHRDDQAETMLLRLLHGAGTEGLAGMRRLRPFARGRMWRPWLGVAREELVSYARRHALAWVEDPSNASPQHAARNHLRHVVIPALQARWPDAARRIAASAARRGRGSRRARCAGAQHAGGIARCHRAHRRRAVCGAPTRHARRGGAGFA